MERRLGSVFALLVLFVVASCVNTPVERQEATSKSLVELQEALNATRAQVDKTLNSMNGLMRAPEGNLRDAYQQFSKDAETITRQFQRLEAESGQMKRRSENWLSSWKEVYGDVKNPELRAATEQRREQVLTRFYTIDGSLAAAQQALKPLITNLQDIRKVMGYDLTSRGVNAVTATNAVQQANENGKLASAALDVVISDLQSLLAVLTPAPSR